MSEHIDNEGHAEALQNVRAGSAAIISDETLPGGRFQVIAHVFGDRQVPEFVLTEWHQESGSADWTSRKHMRLNGAATSRLVQLLHSAGLAGLPHLVDNLPGDAGL